MKKNLFAIVILLLTLNFGAFSQEENESSKINFSAEISNRHMWRGGQTADRISIKPNLEYLWNNFTFGAFGIYTFDNSYNEIDLYVGYKVGNFNFVLYDFYTPNDMSPDFYDYTKSKNVHMLDFTASYTISEDLPLTIMAAGTWSEAEADYNNDANIKGMPTGSLDKISTYIELSYAAKYKDLDITYSLGGAPGHSRYSRTFDENGIKKYWDGAFYIVNMGMKIGKEIQLTDTFSFPLSAGLTFNPHQEKFFFQVNLGIHF